MKMNDFSDDLTNKLTEYHTHIYSILKTIDDFDVWYIKTHKTQFPKEWYTLIRNNNKK